MRSHLSANPQFFAAAQTVRDFLQEWDIKPADVQTIRIDGPGSAEVHFKNGHRKGFPTHGYNHSAALLAAVESLSRRLG